MEKTDDFEADIVIRIILKNIDKKNYSVYGASMALFTAIIYIISSLIYVNDRVNLGADSENIRIIFSFYYVIISLSGIFFIFYALNYYIKSRFRDYSIFVMIGTSKRKALSLLVFEYAVIFVFGLLAGLILGFIIIEIISLVFSFNGVPVKLSILEVFSSIKVSVMVSLIIFIFGCVAGLLPFIRRDLSKIMNVSVKKESRYHWLCILAVAGILLLLYSTALLNKNDFGYTLLSLVLNFIGMFITLSFGLSFIISFIQRFMKNLYIKHLLSISEFTYRYKSNRMIVFITYVLDVIIIYFAGGMIITSYIDAAPGENITVILISSYFMAVFTVVCNMGIMSIKQLYDRKSIMKNATILGCLGMEKNDMMKFSVSEFKILSLIPAVLSNIFAWLYILAECRRVQLMDSRHIIGFVVFQVVIISIQGIYYRITKHFLKRSWMVWTQSVS